MLSSNVLVFYRGTRNGERGAVIPLLIIALPVLLLFVGFALNTAFLLNTRNELKAAVDAAALAAIQQIEIVGGSSDASWSRAEEIATAVLAQYEITSGMAGCRGEF